MPSAGLFHMQGDVGEIPWLSHGHAVGGGGAAQRWLADLSMGKGRMPRERLLPSNT